LPGNWGAWAPWAPLCYATVRALRSAVTAWPPCAAHESTVYSNSSTLSCRHSACIILHVAAASTERSTCRLYPKVEHLSTSRILYQRYFACIRSQKSTSFYMYP